jgi:serralysin
MQTSGIYKIDGLLSNNPGLWQGASNTVYYSFSLPTVGGVSNVTACTGEQQAAVADVLAYVGDITGINFVQGTGYYASNGIHFAQGDIDASFAMGVCEYNGGTSFDIVLDPFTYANMAIWGTGYGRQILLHEIGHALGLDHPQFARRREQHDVHSDVVQLGRRREVELQHLRPLRPCLDLRR